MKRLAFLIFIIYCGCNSEMVKSRQELSQIENQYFFEDKPFNGYLVQHRDMGYYFSKSLVKNGFLNGKAEYFYENGNLERVENYNQNKKQGIAEHFFENKQIHKILNYKNNSKSGYYSEWLIDKNPLLYGHYENDIPVKTWYYLIENDTILIETLDANGGLLELQTSSPFQLEKIAFNDTLTVLISDSHQNQIFEGRYVHRLKDGTLKFHHKNATVTLNYTENLKEGEFRFEKNNKVFMRGNFINDLMEGRWEILDENKFESINYKNGRLY